MAITDIQISEELETNAPSIKYRGNEGPKSPQEMQQMIMASLEEEYLKYVDDMMEQGIEPMTLQQFIDQAMAEGQMSGGQPLPEDPTKPVNPFQPKPTGPVLPDKMMAGTDTPEIEIEMLQELLKLFREKFNRDPVSIDELKRAIGQMREKAAYGGIMGIDGRKQYGIGSFFQKYIKDPIEMAVTGKSYEDLERESQARVDSEPEGYESYFDTLFKGEKGEDDKGRETRTGGVDKYVLPVIGGAVAGLFTKKNEDGNTVATSPDETALQLADLKKSANILDQKQGLAAGLNFIPSVASRKYSPTEMIEVYQNAANGGRIGYNQGNAVVDYESDPNYQGWKQIYEVNPDAASMNENHRIYENYYMSKQNMKAEGGIMDLGGMEKDYRAEGGFVPIGREEKADDVPARLSVNEFVFTADAVRNAGGGDIDQGAQVMENMMKHLEQGGQVSEESQGMAGARDMFATSERLSEVI